MVRETQEQSPITAALSLLDQRTAILRAARESGINPNALLATIDGQMNEHVNEDEYPKTREIFTQASENTGIPMEVKDVVYYS